MTKKAFTLIELLVVIAIVGIISGLIIVAMNGATGAAKDAKRKADIDVMRKALLAYKTLTGSYPVATCANINVSCSALSTALIPTYIGSLPSDPSAGAYAYTSTDGTDFTISSTLSNSNTYSYTGSTGFAGVGGGGGVGAWLTGYAKRKAITVNAASALTNYQVLLSVVYDSDMQSDLRDLRFTSSDKTTLLDYYIESSTTPAKVWVEVPSLASGDNTIYMYYGNSSATSASNGANTFNFFDDFSSGLTKWAYGNGTITASGGKINMSGGSYTNNAYFKTNQKFVFSATSGYAGELKNWSATTVSIGYDWYCGFYNDLTGPQPWYQYPSAELSATHHTSAGDSSGFAVYQTSAAVYSYSVAGIPAQGTDITVAYGPSIAKGYTTDTTLLASSTNASINPASLTGGLIFGCENYDAGSYAGVSSFGPIFVRKYVATEPTATTYGSEESN